MGQIQTQENATKTTVNEEHAAYEEALLDGDSHVHKGGGISRGHQSPWLAKRRGLQDGPHKINTQPECSAPKLHPHHMESTEAMMMTMRHTMVPREAIVFYPPQVINSAIQHCTRSPEGNQSVLCTCTWRISLHVFNAFPSLQS